MPSLRSLLTRLDSEQLMTYSMFMVEFAAGLLAIINGANLLSQVTCSSVGFRFLGITLILIGVALLILWLISCSMARYKLELVFVKFVCCSVPLVLVLLGLGIFVLMVSSEGGREDMEYNVESYSEWMQEKIKENWDVYYKKDVVENKEYSGCCEPPKTCNFNYTNKEDHLLKPEKGSYYSNDDCKRWNNDPNILCFDCQSCKAGFLQDVTSRWSSTGLYLVVLEGFFTLLMVILVIFSCFSGGEPSSPHYRPLA
ncbi:Tetraspanin-9 [Bienertia sinuspersici]